MTHIPRNFVLPILESSQVYQKMVAQGLKDPVKFRAFIKDYYETKQGGSYQFGTDLFSVPTPAPNQPPKMHERDSGIKETRLSMNHTF